MVGLGRFTESEPAQKAYSLLEEFKQFAFKGNVIDLAVGVIIGAAFGKLVDSLVKNLIMPTLGLLLPAQQGYTHWKFVVGQQEIPYGLFLGDVVNFLIIALALYLFIAKFLAWLIRVKAATPPGPTKEQELLTEIRDLLRNRTPP